MRELMDVHGTYPFDSGRWKRVRDLSLKEAAELVGVEITDEECAEHKKSCVGTVCLWVNKGFVLLRQDIPTGKYTLNTAVMETAGFCPEMRGIEVGDQAIYLGDGSYVLIERIER